MKDVSHGLKNTQIAASLTCHENLSHVCCFSVLLQSLIHRCAWGKSRPKNDDEQRLSLYSRSTFTYNPASRPLSVVGTDGHGIPSGYAIHFPLNAINPVRLMSDLFTRERVTEHRIRRRAATLSCFLAFPFPNQTSVSPRRRGPLLRGPC
jgi:hypothetical protein